MFFTELGEFEEAESDIVTREKDREIFSDSVDREECVCVCV